MQQLLPGLVRLGDRGPDPDPGTGGRGVDPVQRRQPEGRRTFGDIHEHRHQGRLRQVGGVVAAAVGLCLAAGPFGQRRRAGAHRTLYRRKALEAALDAVLGGQADALRVGGIELLEQHRPQCIFQHQSHQVQAGGGGLHPGRTGDRLRPGGHGNLADARIVQHPSAALERTQHLVGIVVDKPDPVAAAGDPVGRRQRRADHRRGFTALGHGKHHVIGADPVLLQLQGADQRQVLEPLQRTDQGAVAAGDLAADPIAQPGDQGLDALPRRIATQLLAERTPQPAFQRLGQTPGRSGAIEVDPVAVEKGLLHCCRGRMQPGHPLRVIGQLRKGLPDILVHREQLRQRLLHVMCSHLAQLEGLGVALLGQQGVQLELRAVGQVIARCSRGLQPQAIAGHRRQAGCAQAGEQHEGP